MNLSLQILLVVLQIIIIACQKDQVGVRVTLLDSPLMGNFNYNIKAILQISDIIWCGNNQSNDNNVLILTNKGSVYKSNDRGDNWEKLNEIFQKSAVKALKSLDIKSGFVNKMQKSNVNPNLVIFLGSEGIHWITEDCGDTIKSLGRGEFQYHPFVAEWMIASSWTNCFKQDETKSSQPCHITKELYLSTDTGRSWTYLTNYVVQFTWAIKRKSSIIPSERIIWSQELSGNGHQKISGWNLKTHLFYSDDFFKSKNMIVNQGNKFLLTQSYLFVAQVVNVEDQHVNLLVANPNTKEYNFKYVEIEEELKQHSFTILDSSEGQVFLNINHFKPNSPLGNIYMSDWSGTRFSLSLKDNVRDPGDGQCDFERVQSIQGVYIANVYEGQRAERYKDLIKQSGDIEDIQVERTTSAIKYKGDRRNPVSFQDVNAYAEQLTEFRRSVISFDKGGIWSPISPPEYDNQGKKYKCDINQDCSLHINSVSAKMNYGPFYSTENSVGLIIATGSVGKHLSNRADQINTYLSRDAGKTWFEVKEGSHIYEIGDHGGLIVLANDQKASNKLHYSWDEGLSFSSITFWDQKIEITNIITEPSNIAQRFLIYGETVQEASSDTTTQGVIVSFDFSELHQSQCQGFNDTKSADSDYELWTPNGKISPDCLLGRKMKYTRRKREAKCFNGEKYDKLIYIENCLCTEEDWQCDIGHERQGDGPCVPILGKPVNAYTIPEECNDYYEISQGYRKVSGDTCRGGVDHSAIRIKCPMFSFMSSNVVYNFLLLLGALAILYFFYNNRELVSDLFISCIEWVSNKFPQGKRKQNYKNNYIDFSKMEFEKNEGEQFDSNLIEEEPQNQKYQEEQNEEETIKENQKQTQQQQNQQLDLEKAIYDESQVNNQNNNNLLDDQL